MCYVKDVIDKIIKRKTMILNFAEKVNEKLFEIYGCSDIQLYHNVETNTMNILFMIMDDDEYKSVEVEYDTFGILNANSIQELNIDLDL